MQLTIAYKYTCIIPPPHKIVLKMTKKKNKNKYVVGAVGTCFQGCCYGYSIHGKVSKK